jgi:hypothetical protein
MLLTLTAQISCRARQPYLAWLRPSLEYFLCGSGWIAETVLTSICLSAWMLLTKTQQLTLLGFQTAALAFLLVNPRRHN